MGELTPVTADQLYLAKMAGMDVEIPQPVTVDQMFMQKIIENGGSGGSGGGSGGGYGDYEVLIDEIITTDGAGISTIRYTELDFSNYNDIVIVFDRASNKANSGQDIKVSIRMLGHTLIYNQGIANPVDSYRSCFYRVLNMGNGNVASFASTADNQNNNPSQLYCCGIFPLNGSYNALYDNGFSLDLSQAYIGTINIKILAK